VLNTGPAKKVTVYVMEGQTYHGTACYAAILDYLFFRGISDATVTRGIAGFGTDHKLHTDRLVELADKMPIKVEFVETAERVEEVLPKLTEIASHGLIEVHDTTVIRPTPRNKKQQEKEMPVVKLEAQAKMMRILIGEHDQWQGRPLHEALVQAARANDIAGVTVYRGILGYGANRRMHKDSALNLSHDAPILLTVVDTEQKLRAFVPVLDEMVKQGLIVLSDVDVIKYSHAQPLPETQEAQK
jgi:PII-like signaling protein